MSVQKATHETPRKAITAFQQIPNIGPAMERDFLELGIQQPIDLAWLDPWELYCELASVRGQIQDPCVLDVFMAAIDFMSGAPPRDWWDYTPKRKRSYAKAIRTLREEWEA